MKRERQMKLKNEVIYELQAELCGALAHPVRLKILDLLGEKELNIGEIQGELGISGPNLTQHLNVLKKAGLLHARKAGVFQFCSLAMPQVRSACQVMSKVLEAKLLKTDAAARSLRSEMQG